MLISRRVISVTFALLLFIPIKSFASERSQSIYDDFDDTRIASPAPGEQVYVGPYGDSEAVQIKPDLDAQGRSTLYDEQIARWRDITTIPQTRMECVRWAWGPGWRACVGHKYQSRWIYQSARLTIQTSTAIDIPEAVNSCLKEAAIATAIATMLTSAAGAVPAFEVVMKGCLARQIGAQLLAVSARATPSWGEWE